jgi:hypothetical protein
MELLVSSHIAKVGLALKLSSWFKHPFFTGHGSDVFIRHVEVLVEVRVFVSAPIPGVSTNASPLFRPL